jgi:nucleoside-diphosphate-sugar epimerase
LNVLVTGATGFIGQRLVSRLTSEGHHCLCLVRNHSKTRSIFKEGNIGLISGDIRNKIELGAYKNKIDMVVHLAALMGHDSPSKEAFKKFRSVNVEGTKNIIDACMEMNVNKFIHFSSTAAMGLLTNNVVNEKTICKPYTPYQISKYESELVANEYYEKYGFPAVILRPSMVYGPGFTGDFLTMAKVVKKGFFPKIGFGKNLMPALYIDDLIDGIMSAIERANIGDTYIISSEKSYPLEEVINIISSEIGVNCRNIFIPVIIALLGSWVLEKSYRLINQKPIVTYRNIKSTVTDRIFDIKKAKEILGFKQKVSIQEGLNKTIEYFKSAGLL